MTRSLVLLAGLLATTVSISAQDAKLAQTGKALYASYRCARCHMVDGKGYKNGKLDGVGAKMSADDMRKWLLTPAEMEATLEKKPKVKMSSRKNMKLTDTDVSALVAYLKTLK